MTEGRLHRCMNFSDTCLHTVGVSVQGVPSKDIESSCKSKPGQRSMLHKHTVGFLPAMTAGRRRSKVLRLMPYEHHVDVASCVFSAGEPSVSPQVEDQPMNPEDTVQVSEEVGVEGEAATNTADTQRSTERRLDASASPRSWCGHGTSLPHFLSEMEEHVVPCAPDVGSENLMSHGMTFAHVVEPKGPVQIKEPVSDGGEPC